PALEYGEDLGSDPTSDEHAGREALQGEVAGFDAVERREELQRGNAQRVLARQSQLRDDRVRVRPRGPPGDLARFGGVSAVAQEAVEVVEARAREHALDADAPADFRAQVAQQFDFLIGARGEVDVAALGRDGNVPLAVPTQDGLAEAGARGDDG